MATDPSRRTFLALSTSALALACVEADPLGRWFAARHRAPGDLHRDELEAAVGSQVTLVAADRTRIPARIARVQSWDSQPELDQFTVLFESDTSEALPAGDFRVEHPDFACDLLLSPVVSRRDHVDYEAAFNRFRA